MKKLLAVALVAVASSVAAQQAPSPAKVAVIDVQQLVQDSAAGKEAMVRMKKLQDDKVAQGKKMSDELDALQKQLNAQRSTLTDAKIAELQKEIEDKQIALRRFQDDSQQSLNEAQQKEYSELEKQIMPIITEIGKEMSLDLIFNKYQSGLLYASNQVDITDQVLRRFNTKSTK